MARIIRSASVDNEPVVITYRRESEAPPAEPAVEMPPVDSRLVSEAPLPGELPTDPEPLPPEPVVQDGPSAEELRREALEAGRREGYQAGLRQAQDECAAEIEGLRSLGAALQASLAQGIDGLEDVMVEIAFAAVCKMLGDAVASEEGVRALVRTAMREVRARDGLVLRMSPRDVELLFPEGARSRQVFEEAQIKIAADERVGSGCVIETPGGTLDARLEVQLRQLLDTLTRARGAGGE